MNSIEEKIKAAFHSEESWDDEAMHADPAMHEMILATFKSRYRWLVVMVTCVIVVIFALQFVIAWQFFQAESIKAMIGWATGFMMCWTAIAFLKLQFWVDMNRHAVTRELKRLELQVALLRKTVAR